MTIDIDAFEYAIKKIDDGFIFEGFGTQFLSAVLGYDFVPVGRTKDKGIDGLQYIFGRKDNEKIIYQLSTERDFVGKIEGTIKKLQGNKIEFSRLTYVTNRSLNNTDKVIDKLFEEYGIPVNIFDIKWFSSNATLNEKTINAYRIFVDTYLHEYLKPGKYQTIANLDQDSRLYVFLGQQFDANRTDLQLDDLLADTLILYSLEGTDPDKQKFKSTSEIQDAIKKYLKFDPRLIEGKITERLKILSSKPKKINHHTNIDGYCLPFETRLNISQRNLKDELLYNTFYLETKLVIKKYFKAIDVDVKDVEVLITKVFNTIFSRQGLEFSNFVLHGDSQSVIEQNLNDVIGVAVDESKVILANKDKVKTAIHLAIRDIVYNGSEEQRRFLKSLSNTYLMMFLLQWEPKISMFFQTLASQLVVFVDNSIIIPALSETYLSEGNRRHWNLLIGAKKAGIAMFINETLLDELVAHFKMISTKYHSVFYDNEEFYLTDEFELLFIDDILIRAYFYSKKNAKVRDFNSFIDNFIDPSLKTAKEELIIYLRDMLGITFVTNEKWDIQIDQDEKEKLVEALRTKKYGKNANNDAELILMIYYLRNKNNETASTSIFGYKTWWLSKDTSTFKAVTEAFGGKKYSVSCYIRPDFIYNYIALKPSGEEINQAYKEIFPTMLGVNLSYHMPKEISQVVQERIKDFRNKEPIRIKQILVNLSNKIKSDESLRNRKSVDLYLNEQLKKLKDVK